MAVALRSGRAPTEVADAFDDTDVGGEFLNAGVAGISLAGGGAPAIGSSQRCSKTKR